MGVPSSRLHSYSVFILLILCSVGLSNAQEESSCYGPGSIAASVILTLIFTVLLLVGLYLAWRKYKLRKRHLILETDPEKGKGEFAFDNPGFKDTSILAIPKAVEKSSKLESSKPKWNQWSPLSALTTKSEKRKTLDDSALEGNEVKVVALRSHDFTGLGFNICGNMKEGIYIKDILHRGPAFESGKLNAGDRINSVTISFEHMVYEDALTILSYASPYEVIIEAKTGKLIHHANGQGAQPSHPVYRSSSCTDLFHIEKSSKKRLFGDEYTGSLSSNYSSLQKSRSNMTTLERKESKSPKSNHRGKKVPPKHLSPEQLKVQLEQKIMHDHQTHLKQNQKPTKVESETQKTENKHHKFGIRVLPMDQQRSPKSAEQNENNLNIEKRIEEMEEPIRSIDEVDEVKKVPPQAKKREKKPDVTPEKESFVRQGSLNGSGIKRDSNGIPQEIPAHMLNAAVAARKNRKGSIDNSIEKDDDSFKKVKGKAPAPPSAEEKSLENLDEIHFVRDEEIKTISTNEKQDTKENVKDYISDSDVENDNHSSVNTIELNSSDITIHQTEEEEHQNRKTASTGDLTKIQKTRKSSTGTLERAQSLDITDTSIPTLKRKGGRIEDTMKSDEDLFGKVMLNKEPRLSLILDGLNTFQRNRLKKSTEWGNLEDAILKLNQEDEHLDDGRLSPESFALTFGQKSPEFDALVDKINEIKRESIEINIPAEVIEKYNKTVNENIAKSETKQIKNEIWPFKDDEVTKLTSNGETHKFDDIKSSTKKSPDPQPINGTEKVEIKSGYERRQQYLPENNVSYPPSTIEKEEEPKVSIRVEKRQMRPSQSLEESALPTEQEYNKPRSTSVHAITVPSELLKNDWEITVSETLEDTPMPKELLEPIINQPPEKHKRQRLPEQSKLTDKTTESKIPLLNSNNTDETKTVVTYVTREPHPSNLKDVTQNFLFTEQLTCSQNDNIYTIKPYDINVSDDIKVSRHSHSSLDTRNDELVPKSDDAKSEIDTKNVSNIKVNNFHSENGDTGLHSLEVSINEPSELYTTALDSTVINEPIKEILAKTDSTKVTVSTPDLIKNVTLTEAINTLNNDVTIHGPSSLTVEIPKELVEVTETRFSKITKEPSKELLVDDDNDSKNSSVNSNKNSSMTYVTEIQVLTPNNSSSKNVSEIEIVQNVMETNNRNLDHEFENYLKKFESEIETNIPDFESSMKEFIDNEPKSIIINEKIDPEKELHKIQEIAEQQLKKLPEMRFTTSSYEPSKIQEKRQSQIEMLRSNFEKSPPKTKSETTPTKSRIPISTTMKTPPMSPERRDSRNLDMEHDKAILELMSSTVHSTPLVTHSKYQIKSPSKNVTVTSIRSNSKIPSGLPTLTSSRPPIPPKKVESHDGDHSVQISTNGNMESSFKQWVFNPSNNAVTNIVVTESKEKS